MPQTTDKLLSSSRREAVLVFTVWALALLYTISVCYWWGYQRPVEDLTFVFGVPDWVFWGLVVPWFACLAFNFWFSFWFMQDAELEADASPGPVRLDEEVPRES